MDNPNLNDCFLAGLWLRDGLRLMKAIEENPDVPPQEWWRVLETLSGTETVH